MGVVAMLMIVCKSKTGHTFVFSNLLMEYFSKHGDNEQNLDNIFKLGLCIFKIENEFAGDVVEFLGKEVLIEFGIGHFMKASVYANMIVEIIREIDIENPVKLKIFVLFISILNYISSMSKDRQNTYVLKEIVLNLLFLAFKNAQYQNQFLSLVHNQNKSYFNDVQNPSLNDIIHQSYRQKSKLPSSRTSPSELIQCLPQLLKTEFQLLPFDETLIESFISVLDTCSPELAEHLMLGLVTRASVEASSSDSSETLLSLLSELFGLLAVVNNDMQDVVWPCLHNLLSQYIACGGNIKFVLPHIAIAKSGVHRDTAVKILRQNFVEC